jgi:hypothetical protein
MKKLIFALFLTCLFGVFSCENAPEPQAHAIQEAEFTGGSGDGGGQVPPPPPGNEHKSLKKFNICLEG